MYWCASSSHGQSPEIIEAKWVSICHHVVNKHTFHDNELYTQCNHKKRLKTANRKKWMDKSVYFMLYPLLIYLRCIIYKLDRIFMYKLLFSESPAYDVFCKMVKKKSVLKDVKKMSTGQQTSNVEAYHSVIIHFAPKNTFFPYLGMQTR